MFCRSWLEEIGSRLVLATEMEGCSHMLGRPRSRRLTRRTDLPIVFGRPSNDMRPRAPPKAYQLLLKTHRLTIFLTVPQSSTVAALKEEALSALTAEVLLSSSAPPTPRIPTAPGEDDEMLDEEGESGGEGLPRVKATPDFELCRAVKDKANTRSPQ
ncbi:hypothetical protein F5I97DRAFT_836836 [Phlebopus sp. FC_14]|nr:hypothetical protein F5I97DRAFT_836836 [Phlebopus sp. FC_14]